MSYNLYFLFFVVAIQGAKVPANAVPPMDTRGAHLMVRFVEQVRSSRSFTSSYTFLTSLLNLQLTLSVEHSGFVFEPEPAVAADLLKHHSGGHISEALLMAMNRDNKRGAAISAATTSTLNAAATQPLEKTNTNSAETNASNPIQRDDAQPDVDKDSSSHGQTYEPALDESLEIIVDSQENIPYHQEAAGIVHKMGEFRSDGLLPDNMDATNQDAGAPDETSVQDASVIEEAQSHAHEVEVVLQPHIRDPASVQTSVIKVDITINQATPSHQNEAEAEYVSTGGSSQSTNKQSEVNEPLDSSEAEADPETREQSPEKDIAIIDSRREAMDGNVESPHGEKNDVAAEAWDSILPTAEHVEPSVPCANSAHCTDLEAPVGAELSNDNNNLINEIKEASVGKSVEVEKHVESNDGVDLPLIRIAAADNEHAGEQEVSCISIETFIADSPSMNDVKPEWLSGALTPYTTSNKTAISENPSSEGRSPKVLDISESQVSGSCSKEDPVIIESQHEVDVVEGSTEVALEAPTVERDADQVVTEDAHGECGTEVDISTLSEAIAAEDSSAEKSLPGAITYEIEQEGVGRTDKDSALAENYIEISKSTAEAASDVVPKALVKVNEHLESTANDRLLLIDQGLSCNPNEIERALVAGYDLEAKEGRGVEAFNTTISTTDVIQTKDSVCEPTMSTNAFSGSDEGLFAIRHLPRIGNNVVGPTELTLAEEGTEVALIGQDGAAEADASDVVRETYHTERELLMTSINATLEVEATVNREFSAQTELLLVNDFRVAAESEKAVEPIAPESSATGATASVEVEQTSAALDGAIESLLSPLLDKTEKASTGLVALPETFDKGDGTVIDAKVIDANATEAVGGSTNNTAALDTSHNDNHSQTLNSFLITTTAMADNGLHPPNMIDTTVDFKSTHFAGSTDSFLSDSSKPEPMPSDEIAIDFHETEETAIGESQVEGIGERATVAALDLTTRVNDMEQTEALVPEEKPATQACAVDEIDDSKQEISNSLFQERVSGEVALITSETASGSSESQERGDAPGYRTTNLCDGTQIFNLEADVHNQVDEDETQSVEPAAALSHSEVEVSAVGKVTIVAVIEESFVASIDERSAIKDESKIHDHSVDADNGECENNERSAIKDETKIHDHTADADNGVRDVVEADIPDPQKTEAERNVEVADGRGYADITLESVTGPIILDTQSSLPSYEAVPGHLPEETSPEEILLEKTSPEPEEIDAGVTSTEAETVLAQRREDQTRPDSNSEDEVGEEVTLSFDEATKIASIADDDLVEQSLAVVTKGCDESEEVPVEPSAAASVKAAPIEGQLETEAPAEPQHMSSKNPVAPPAAVAPESDLEICPTDETYETLNRYGEGTPFTRRISGAVVSDNVHQEGDTELTVLSSTEDATANQTIESTAREVEGIGCSVFPDACLQSGDNVLDKESENNTVTDMELETSVDTMSITSYDKTKSNTPQQRDIQVATTPQPTSSADNHEATSLDNFLNRTISLTTPRTRIPPKMIDYTEPNADMVQQGEGHMDNAVVDDETAPSITKLCYESQIVARQEVDMTAMTDRPFHEITATKEEVSTLASEPPQYSSDPPIDTAPSPLVLATSAEVSEAETSETPIQDTASPMILLGSGDLTECDVMALLSQGDSVLVTSGQSGSFTLAESTDCIDRMLMNVESRDSLDLLSLTSPKEDKTFFCMPCW